MTPRPDSIAVLHVAIPLPGGDRASAAAVPMAFLRLVPAVAPSFYWQAPGDPDVVAAFGATHVALAEGSDRFGSLRDQVVAAAARMRIEAAPRETREMRTATAVDIDTPPVRWLGGFAFEDHIGGAGLWSGFPAAMFVLPAVSLTIRDDRAWLTLTSARADAGELATRAAVFADWVRAMADATAGSDEDRIERDIGSDVARDVDNRSDADADPDLVGRIARVVDAIRRGEADKVVLATTHAIVTPAARNPLRVLAHLRVLQPDCFHFLVAPGDPGQPMTARLPSLRRQASPTLPRLQSPGNDPPLANSPLAPPTFLGATPERLIRVQGERVSTMALAGSARRDADPAVDAALGAALLAGAKDRAEHEWVVDAIVDALHDLDVAVDPFESPRLRLLATLQHLETPIQGRWRDSRGDILAAAERLHPTPALGGTPRAAALRLIRAAEPFDRGWYGGGVGWLDGRGDGDLAVAIRSVLLRGDTATAFAGAGLVAASDPAAEAREIALKLAAALAGV